MKMELQEKRWAEVVAVLLRTGSCHGGGACESVATIESPSITVVDTKCDANSGCFSHFSIN